MCLVSLCMDVSRLFVASVHSITLFAAEETSPSHLSGLSLPSPSTPRPITVFMAV